MKARLRPVVALAVVAAACAASGEPAPTTAAAVATAASTEAPVPTTAATSTLPEASITAPSVTASPATTTEVPLEERRVFTIAAAGDVLIHEALADAAAAHAGGAGYDFVPLLAPVEPWISPADLAICHLEGTLSPDNTGLLYQSGQEHPALFNAPREVAGALEAVGFDACSTASNHSLDRGTEGIHETLDVLDAFGIRHAGTARTEGERGPRLYEVDGVVVGHLSYTFATNVWFSSAERTWELDLLDPDAILADAALARSEGAEFVILSLHWGVEYQPEPTGAQVALAERLLASPDLDLILGHHSHVVSPIDWVGDEIVVYGMGNLISNIRGLPDGTKVGGEDGMIVGIVVREQDDGSFRAESVELTPTWVHPATKQVLPVAETLATGGGSYEAALRASWERTLARALAFEPGRVTVTGQP